MKTRMQPISTAWQKLPRLVRDLCAELGKDIELVLPAPRPNSTARSWSSSRTRSPISSATPPTTALETPEERRLVGKPPRGTIRISAIHESGTITIEVADDGRGLDVGRIAAKALERGLVTPAELERLSDDRIARFIFEPGFTTVHNVSHVSGPRRRNGRGALQHRADRRLGRRALGAGRGLHPHDEDPADAGDRGGADHRDRRASASPSRRWPWWSWCSRAPPPSTGWNPSTAPALLRLRDTLLPVVRLGAILGIDPREPEARPGGGLHRRPEARQALLRPRGRQGVPHRGDRREADLQPAEADQRLLRQHHPGRRPRDPDPGSERHRAAHRPHAGADPLRSATNRRRGAGCRRTRAPS